MQSKKIVSIMSLIFLLGTVSVNHLSALGDFHRGPHPGDQHSGNADPKYHGEVKHPGDSTHHSEPFQDGEF